MNLFQALKYAAKVRASAADYHRAFDRLAADPKAEEGANEKALVPTEFFADHLRSEGQHPQADLIQQAMAHSKQQGEPVVYSEQIAKFPPHHREMLEGLGQGDFHLVLGKPNSDYTNVALYQRSHTDPSKVFGWTDSIEGNPDEVKAEVERFQRAGVPVELAIGPHHKDYAKWAKHFGLSGYSEEPEQHSTLERALKYVQETHADFLNRILEDGGHTTPQLVYADWLEETQGKSGLAAAIRKHTEEHQYGPDHRTGGQVHFSPAGGVERLFDTDPNPVTFNYHPQSGLIVQQHSSETPSDTVVWRTAASPEAEEIAKQMHKEGAVPVDMPKGWEAHKDPVLKSVNPTYGEPADPVSEHFSAAEKHLRYSAVPEHEVHEDYAPNGVAPRIGHTLKQLAQEDSTTGALAEGILRTGDHSILPILADRLEETEHPLAQAFDWRHAPRAIRIDRALHRQINSRQVRHPDGHRVPLTAGWVLADMQDGVQRPAFSRRKALLAARLAVPDATTEDLLHSLFRLMDHREVADTAPELVQPVADHTKALTAARLQKLRQRAGNPYQYADTRQPNKQVYSAKPVRYSHEAFQKQLVAHPNDHTTAAVYGDFVEDANGPTHAEVVRRAAEGSRKGGGWHNGGHFWIAGNSLWGDKGDFSVAVNAPFGSTDTGWSLDLASRHLHEAPSGEVRKPIFTLHDLSRDEVKRLVKGLHAEGASTEGVETAYGARDLWKEIQDEQKPTAPEPTYEDTKKYGSWRAPAGGMVVQQSPLAVTGQWAEGGEFVNDLQKLAPQPVDYKKKPKKRLTVEYLRQHFRKRRKAKGVAGARVIDDTAGEGDAGAEAGTE